MVSNYSCHTERADSDYLLPGVLSQTTATIFPGDGGDGATGIDGIGGEIAGTGADGTTYIISVSISGVLATGAHFIGHMKYTKSSDSFFTLKLRLSKTLRTYPSL